MLIARPFVCYESTVVVGLAQQVTGEGDRTLDSCLYLEP